VSGVSLKVVAGLLRVLLGSGGGGASGKDSLAYIQLEKHNERLKEALIKYVPPQSVHGISSCFYIRLRDMSQETEQEQRRRISDMEKDIIGLDDLQCAQNLHLHLNMSLTVPTAQYDSTLIKLANSETQIEDLKLQLDDALGAEDLLVQLTERNLMLSEVCNILFDIES
jgi:dynactin 1